MRRLGLYLLLVIVLSVTNSITNKTFAQYPTVPDEVQKETDLMMKSAYAHSDAAWEKALPVIEKEASEGRPYIPWAYRPYDLPQGDIPAFPGAEGGGMYTIGGRGGKVITVTRLGDSGPGTFREACETGGARISLPATDFGTKQTAR